MFWFTSGWLLLAGCSFSPPEQGDEAVDWLELDCFCLIVFPMLFGFCMHKIIVFTSMEKFNVPNENGKWSC